MSRKSAGLLLYRFHNNLLEVLLVHPGGPFWAKRDTGAWSIPKGEFDDNEDPLNAAKRETCEETGIAADMLNPVIAKFIRLTPVKQNAGKVVFAWALETDFNPSEIRSNAFEMEWPPKSGKINLFPEVDKAGWFQKEEAKMKIIPGQVPLIEELALKFGC